MAILIGAILGIITAQLLIWLLAYLIKPLIQEWEDKEWEEFRKEYYKENGIYPRLRYIAM